MTHCQARSCLQTRRRRAAARPRLRRLPVAEADCLGRRARTGFCWWQRRPSASVLALCGACDTPREHASVRGAHLNAITISLLLRLLNESRMLLAAAATMTPGCSGLRFNVWWCRYDTYCFACVQVRQTQVPEATRWADRDGAPPTLASTPLNCVRTRLVAKTQLCCGVNRPSRMERRTRWRPIASRASSPARCCSAAAAASSATTHQGRCRREGSKPADGRSRCALQQR